ncbi:CAP domain-containing protein [Kitasatospora cystarginea]
MSSDFETVVTAPSGEGHRRAGGQARRRDRRRAASGSAGRARRIATMAGAAALVVAAAGAGFGILAASGSAPRPQTAAALPDFGAPAPVLGTPSAAPSNTTAAASPTAAASASPTSSPTVAAPGPAGSSTAAQDSAKQSGTAAAKGGAASPGERTAAAGGSAQDRTGDRTSGRSATPGGPPAKAPTVSGDWPASQSVADAEAISLQLINKERAMAGVPALKPASDLAAFATQWAKHMRETGFAHSANASGAGPSRTAHRTLTGECIVMWSDPSMTAEQAAVQFQDMWRNHLPHYLAQINPAYTEIGVGIYHDESGWWGVHEFGNG